MYTDMDGRYHQKSTELGPYRKKRDQPESSNRQSSQTQVKITPQRRKLKIHLWKYLKYILCQ